MRIQFYNLPPSLAAMLIPVLSVIAGIANIAELYLLYWLIKNGITKYREKKAKIRLQKIIMKNLKSGNKVPWWAK